jgi:hypothetical protein
MDTENTHYCELHEKCLEDRGVKGMRADLWHMDHCTCFLVECYNFFMVEQYAHIRAYWEHKGLLKVIWSPKWGVLFEYPAGLVEAFCPKDKERVSYPYPDERELKRRELYIERMNKIDRKIESARRRKHLRVLWWRKRR